MNKLSRFEICITVKLASYNNFSCLVIQRCNACKLSYPVVCLEHCLISCRSKPRQRLVPEDIVHPSIEPVKTDRYVGVHKPFLLIFASAHLLGTVCQVSSKLTLPFFLALLEPLGLLQCPYFYIS